jgi:hypothetical protein
MINLLHTHILYLIQTVNNYKKLRAEKEVNVKTRPALKSLACRNQLVEEGYKQFLEGV